MTSFAYALKPLCRKRSILVLKKKRRHKIEDYLLKRFGFDPRLEDVRERKLDAKARLKTVFSGRADHANGKFYAIYAHYNPKNRVSDMVHKQLEHIRAQGFKIFFVTMSEVDDPQDVARLQRTVVELSVRKSFGRDFGAWRDIWEVHNATFLDADEVLLINDSILGPIRRLDPIFDAIRSAGDGLFGLTDSPDGYPHLQTYFLQFNGSQSIKALDEFFKALLLSFDKKRMINRGELALTQHFEKKKIPIRTVFSFDEVENAAVENDDYFDVLVASFPALLPEAITALATDDSDATVNRLKLRLRHALLGLALNPTHYYWRVLIEEFGFPFIKTELLAVNPGRIPDIFEWPEVVPSDSPIATDVIRSHLSTV